MKALTFIKELVLSREFLTGLLIGSTVLAVAYGATWLVY